MLKCLKRLDESIPSSDPILHNSFDAFFLRNRTKLLTSDADARDFLAACPELAARVTMLAVTDRVPPYNAQHLPCPDCRSPQCIHPGSDLRGCQRCTSCRALLRVMYSPNGASCEHDWNMVPKLIKATDEWSDGWG